MKKLLALALAAVMVLTLVPGCSNSNSSQPEPQGYDGEKIFYSVTGGQLASLNCVGGGTEFYDGRIDLNGSFVTLMAKKDGSGIEFVPNHAEELPQGEEGGTVFNVKIRDGLSWNDGTPLTAETYEYTCKMMLDPLLAYESSSKFYSGTAVVTNALAYFKGECEWEDVGIKVLPDNIIQFSLDFSCSDMDFWNSIGAFPPAHEGLFEAGMNADRTSTNYATSIDSTPSAGVFYLDEWVLDQKLVFKKNAQQYPLSDYFKIDGITIYLLNDSTAAYQMFLRGEVDGMSVGSSNWDEFSEDPRLMRSEGFTSWGMWLNQESNDCPALAIKEFRQALYYGVPRQTARDIGKTPRPAAYFVPPICYVGSPLSGGQKYRDTAEANAVCAIDDYKFEPDRAKELFDIAYEQNGNRKITLQLQYMETQDTVRSIGEVMKETYEDLFGADRFELVMSAQPPITVYTNLSDGNFQASFAANSISVFNPWDGFKNFRGDYIGRRHRWNNDEFNELQFETTKGSLLFDEKGRLEALARMEEILIDELPFIPVYVAAGASIWSDRIELAVDEYQPVVGYAPFQCDITGPQAPFVK